LALAWGEGLQGPAGIEGLRQDLSIRRVWAEGIQASTHRGDLALQPSVLAVQALQGRL
jgi:hypothetical protein